MKCCAGSSRSDERPVAATGEGKRFGRAPVRVCAFRRGCVAAVVAALLIGSYFAPADVLAGRTENAAETRARAPSGRPDRAQAQRSSHRHRPRRLRRRRIASPSCSASATRCAQENTACAMTADQTPTFIVIRVCDLVLFASGEATVLDAFKPIALRVAATLEKEPGRIGSLAIPTVRRSAQSASRQISCCPSSAPRRLPRSLKPGLTDAVSASTSRAKDADAPIGYQHDTRGTRQEPARRNLHRTQRIGRYRRVRWFATGTVRCLPRTFFASFSTE